MSMPPYISRRSFIRSSTLLAGGLACGKALLRAAGANPSLVEQLGLTDRCRQRIAQLDKRGLTQVVPVVAAPAGEHRHLGWPVATRMSGGRIVVIFQRAWGGHQLAGKLAAAEPPSGRYALYTDDLLNWLPADPFAASARLGPPDGLHCVGSATAPDGKETLVVVASGKPREVYLSSDGGQTWRRNAGALDGLLEGAVICGPNMVSHPEFGLVAVFGQERGESRKNFLVRSRDAGKTWEERIWTNTKKARSVEPAAAAWGPGHMVMISREYNTEYGINADGYYCHTQHVYTHTPGAPFSRVQFTTDRSNITGNPAAGAKFDCHDTADVIYNPVSGRIECLQSHRWGGGGPDTGKTLGKAAADRRHTLNLWSIAPDDLLNGSTAWRFDGTLLERGGYSRRADRDGLHPGGSVVDLARGMQHIFIYAGWRRTPCSIFRVSRILDTERLRRELLAK